MTGIQDLRLAVRLLRRQPGVTLVAVLALACGIGLTATMYSIVYGALLRGLPFADGDRYVFIDRTIPRLDVERSAVPFHDFADWRAEQRSFADIAAFYTGTVNITDGDRPERYDGGFVSAGTLALTGVQPLLGRTFLPEDDLPGAPRVVVLGYDTWQNRFAGDPGVLGRTLRVNGEPGTVIGVMPPGFRFPNSEQLWITLRMDAARLARGEGTSLLVYGKLRPGVTPAQARADLDRIAARLGEQYPLTNEGVSTIVTPYTKRFIGPDASALLYTMLGAVFLVLLVACANVANLLLSRAALRSREVAVRTTLGATRRRVVLQFLAESLVLASAGAVLGVGIALLGVRLFNAAIAGTDPPFWLDITVDAPILLFVVGVTLLATLFSGALPAWQAARANVNEILKDESRGGTSFRMGRLSKALVVAEIALSCGLLVGAALMIRSVVKLRTVDYGFPAASIFTARVGLPDNQYDDVRAQIRFYEDVLPRVAAVPGVRHAALTSSLPVLGAPTWRVGIDGVAYADPERDQPRANRILITPGFFDTFDVPLRAGRDFGVEDRDGALPVAIVNESFARLHFPDGDVLGRRVQFGLPANADTVAPWLTIVGVVPDIYAGGLENETPQAVYVPFAQYGARFMSIAARPATNPLSLTPHVRDAVMAVDPDIPLYFVDTLAGRISEQTWFYRVFGSLFMIFGLVALLLAGVGLYAVMAFSVSRRTREVGVRMALGAQSGDVVGMIMRQALAQIGVGLALGLVLAALVSRLLAVLLFEVHPRDPATFASIIALLVATGILAAFVPARRAASVEPQTALRYE